MSDTTELDIHDPPKPNKAVSLLKRELNLHWKKIIYICFWNENDPFYDEDFVFLNQ